MQFVEESGCLFTSTIPAQLILPGCKMKPIHSFMVVPFAYDHANFLFAWSLTGVKKLIKFPSGSRNNKDRFPQGMVVGI